MEGTNGGRNSAAMSSGWLHHQCSNAGTFNWRRGARIRRSKHMADFRSWIVRGLAANGIEAIYFKKRSAVVRRCP